MNQQVLASFHDELEKIALRAGGRLIQKIFAHEGEQGLGQIGRIATHGGINPRNAVGLPLKHLGGQGEGVVDLVAHPQFGASARKLYNPGSQVASPTMISRKVQMAKQVESPLLAQTQGVGRTGSGGRMTFHEYVPGAEAIPQEVAKLKPQLQQVGAQKGYQIEDINKGENWRGGKAIDYLPFHKGEALGMMGSNVALTPKGGGLMNRQMTRRTNRGMISDKNLYRTLQGPGGVTKSVQQIPTAPQRAPLKLPTGPFSQLPATGSSGVMGATSAAVPKVPSVKPNTAALPKPPKIPGV